MELGNGRRFHTCACSHSCTNSATCCARLCLLGGNDTALVFSQYDTVQSEEQPSAIPAPRAVYLHQLPDTKDLAPEDLPKIPPMVARRLTPLLKRGLQVSLAVLAKVAQSERSNSAASSEQAATVLPSPYAQPQAIVVELRWAASPTRSVSAPISRTRGGIPFAHTFHPFHAQHPCWFGGDSHKKSRLQHDFLAGRCVLRPRTPRCLLAPLRRGMPTMRSVGTTKGIIWQ